MDNMEKMMQQITEMLAKAEADRKADQEEMLARIKEEDRQANQELLARMVAYHEKRMAMLDAQQKRIMACFGQTEVRLEYEETGSRNMEDDRNEATAYNEETEKIETDPGMMQSAEEHQLILSEDVAVMPVKGLKRRHRVQKLAAERRQKLKEWTGGYCGARKRVTIACRKNVPPCNSGMV
jgi:hypothetical protein